MSNKPKVSIVIPVYNVENYIERCLNSLINQTMKEIEIIAINDGSIDNSLDILKRFAKKDIRIKVIDNENMGVSYCRNIGIQQANGKYITFVDSDDWIDKDTIEIMYSKAEEENCDMVMCTYTKEFASQSRAKIFDFPEISIWDEQYIKNNLLRGLIGPIGNELGNPQNLDSFGTVWGKLYRTEVIKENRFEFVDLKKIGSAEDILFNVYVFNKLNKVIFINKPLYHYWKDNLQSITSKYNPRLKVQRKVFFEYIKEFIDNNNLDEIYYKALNNRICVSTIILGLVECYKDNKDSHFNKVKKISNLLKEDYIVDAFKELELEYFPLHWKVLYFFMKYRIVLVAYPMLGGIQFLREKM